MLPPLDPTFPFFLGHSSPVPVFFFFLRRGLGLFGRFPFSATDCASSTFFPLVGAASLPFFFSSLTPVGTSPGLPRGRPPLPGEGQSPPPPPDSKKGRSPPRSKAPGFFSPLGGPFFSPRKNFTPPPSRFGLLIEQKKKRGPPFFPLPLGFFPQCPSFRGVGPTFLLRPTLLFRGMSPWVTILFFWAVPPPGFFSFFSTKVVSFLLVPRRSRLSVFPTG